MHKTVTPRILQPTKDHVAELFKRHLGPPLKHEVDSLAFEETSGLHPVFLLAEHYRGNDDGDPGYTENQCRGDHLSIPGFTENGTVFAIDVGFHKGNTWIELVTFPDMLAWDLTELIEILQFWETR